MRSYGFLRSISLACMACAVSIAALPARAVDFVWRLVVDLPSTDIVRRLADLVRGPAFAIVDGPSSEIDSATYQHNRHEAGLARLGTVRHI